MYLSRTRIEILVALAALFVAGCASTNSSGGGAATASSARASSDDDGDTSDDDDDAPAARPTHHASKKDKASVHGKYSGLVKTVNVPGDRDQYGDFNDYGMWGPGEWAGEMQPQGYWVYVYPNWYIWKTQGGGGSDEAAAAGDDGSDDDEDEAPRPKKKKKHHASGGGESAPATASGSGQGANRDLACASAKLQATQNASCSNIGSAIGGAACDCNQLAPTMWMCSTQVTCR